MPILILGSGAGGKLLAWDMASAGHRRAVVAKLVDDVPPGQPTEWSHNPVAPTPATRLSRGTN